MPNALAHESSPYLRQHEDNPVDWLPWGRKALALASERGCPLLVSIGYSACHWCHVMERESFEDPVIAAIMNENFVCVKVDREERPDIDAIYMQAVQGMTGHGGWPLTVFLTPEQLPFYGGTYFPPEERHGMPAFAQVLQAVAEAWHERSTEIRTSAREVTERLSGAARLGASGDTISEEGQRQAVARLSASFDETNGGFGGAPKFPPSSALAFLAARAALAPEADRQAETTLVLATLRSMARGGMHDVLAGGFHRYAVDETWTVPHFEKMLYDNALLARCYLHGFKLSGERELLDVCVSTLKWALAEMRGPEGGFYSALDADSEGIEGRFYVWTLAELRQALGEDADVAIRWFAATEHGNFSDPHHPQPGLNVLQSRGPAPDGDAQASIRERLLSVRSKRARPALDDKRLASWNALIISALAETGAYLQSVPLLATDAELGETFLQAASTCAEFVLTQMRDSDGRLLRTYSQGHAKLQAYLEDHAFLLEALIDLYEATFQERWFIAARDLAGKMIDSFSDPGGGGFFTTAADHETLITRRKDLEDHPIPSGSSSAATGLLRLAALTGEDAYEQHAVSTMRLTHEVAQRHPTYFGYMLRAIELYLAPRVEVALVGPDRQELERVVRERLRPNVVLAGRADPQGESAVALLEGRMALENRATAYVCERFSCKQPVTSPQELEQLLS